MKPSAAPDSTAESLLEPRDIADLLNYRLFSLLAFSGAAVIRLCEGKYGISRREWHIVAILAKHQSLAPSDISTLTHLDRARVSRAITQLREKELLHREPCPGDQRRAQVRLTAHGERLYRHLFREVAKLNTALTSTLDPAFVAQFDAALDQLTERAKILAQETAPGIHANRWRGRGQRRPWDSTNLEP
ncbi:MAG: MarR family transcriptional regulator [Pigmentiphaga sp.]|nr:MarR family transcriptional regulator [Pigmentiphaga sp.]